MLRRFSIAQTMAIAAFPSSHWCQQPGQTDSPKRGLNPCRESESPLKED